jgi:hypothetical protein
MLKVVGKGGISATMITDSIHNGNRMVTMEIEYPRFILAELNTHRMLSKNSASSRAIPVAKMHEQIMHSGAVPVYWGLNQPGMSAKEEAAGNVLSMAKEFWALARNDAIHHARAFSDIGIHKQITNRITEPFMMMKTVISGTEWDNMFWLRDHEDAQPEFAELAKCMRDLMHHSQPVFLKPGEWHLPYVDFDGDKYTSNGVEVELDTAIKISVSCCAQVSYRKNDSSIEKAEKIFEMLNLTPGNRQAHASPTEHQATPMARSKFYDIKAAHTVQGVSHIDLEGNAWSGNLRGWSQYRKILGM